ncbi:uncharacterized protein LOC111364202, partial [Spodoptera litura]|uniref:Uncharacterized protein LOC111364202 n=1 Tax=Spodoptera litura TaxID=69820 RepID=A0A9J7J3Y4_SPOLT
MSDSDTGTHVPLSEVGCEKQSDQDTQPHNQPSNSGLLTNMEALLTRLLAMPQQTSQPVANTNAVQLIKFDPDDEDADVKGWCRVSELIIHSKNLIGVELLVALTTALKGRAASVLTKLRLEDLTWEVVKQALLAKFAEPKLMQDYFDEVLRFQIGTKETASESAMRLWALIERIPKDEMLEEAITGFVISVLSSKDNMIRRELNSYAITTRAQLFRTLGGVSLKRRTEDNDGSDNKIKKPRPSDSKFNGKCHRCGVPGHKIAECKRRRDDSVNRADGSKDQIKDRSTPITCFSCGKPGHVSTSCPEKRGGAAVREVNTCEHKTSRGKLTTASGEHICFLFDSGSSCSLIKESVSSDFPGIERNNTVYLTGIGGDDIECDRQISSTVQINNLCLTLLFHVVPNNCISENVIVGRDVLENGVRVEIDNENLFISTNEKINFCESVQGIDVAALDTDLVGDEKEALLGILLKYTDHFISGTPTKRVNTGVMKIELIDPNKIVQRRPYRLSPIEKQVVRDKVQELLKAGVIRESSSPFASPILLVKKKDDTDRMCVDYRELNSNTRPEHYPLPLIDDQIDQLTGAYYFSCLDMASGFHQILIHPESVEKTAFVTPEGQYEYVAMPFGLRNAPSVYQRCINDALKYLKDGPLVYMDDVLCHSSDVTEGLRRLDRCLGALTKAGFSLNL